MTGAATADGSNRGSNDRGSNRLNVDVGFSRDLDINIGLSWDLLMDVRLSRDLDIHIWLSCDLFMDIRLSSDLSINIGLSCDFLMDVGLSCRVKVGIGNRWVIRPSIDSTIYRGCREASRKGSREASREASIASRNTGIGSRENCRVGVSSISTMENNLGTGHSQAGEGGNKRLHSDL